MTSPASRRLARNLTIASALALLIGLGGPSSRAQQLPSREVTVFGVLATPGGTRIDPGLKGVEAQLRKLLPGNGFKLLGARTERLEFRQAMACNLADGFVARTELLNGLDPNGKVLIRFKLDKDGQNWVQTTVTTPPNQLFFCDKLFPDGTRLVIGIGAR